MPQETSHRFSTLPRTRWKMMTAYLVLLAVAVALFFTLRGCRGQHDIYGPRQRGGSAGDTIDIALVYAPMSYYMYGDTLGGYSYDLLRDISAAENVPIKIWPVNSLQEALRLLQEGKFRLLASLPVDAGYKQMVIYSEPVFLDRQVLVQRLDRDSNAAVGSSLDLAGDTVHIEAGSPIAGRLRNLSHEIGDTIYVDEHSDMSSELLVLAVERGEIRYAVVNELIATPLARQFPSLDISSPISFTQFQGIVAAPGDKDLIRQVNDWLKRADERPSVKALKKRYNVM